MINSPVSYGCSIRPLFEAYKYFRDSGGKDKERLKTYLDGVVAEIEKVKRIWDKNVAELRTAAKLASKSQLTDNRSLQSTGPVQTASSRMVFGGVASGGSNVMPFSMVEAHYRRATTVIKDRMLQKDRDGVVDALGSFINCRNELLELYDPLMEDINDVGIDRVDQLNERVHQVTVRVKDLFAAASEFEVSVAAFKAL